ncbi:MAG: Unknown protein [uncultured Aureispira sp.]|uniref:Uncharacterized protein n=1 Tax=uncultured Aureispira sp. TaxID=1331704 RepID=A0A6S6UJW2_9BACT|nr:MAG: Unknown protein [uncultured Aureispira sp.]
MENSSLEITAQSILFLMPPGVETAFQVRLGVQTANEGLLSKGDFTIANCKDISDAVKKALQLIEKMNLTMAADFMLVLPPFVGRNEAEEAGLINTAWSIKEAADHGGWGFSRYLPVPIF